MFIYIYLYICGYIYIYIYIYMSLCISLASCNCHNYCQSIFEDPCNCQNDCHSTPEASLTVFGIFEIFQKGRKKGRLQVAIFWGGQKRSLHRSAQPLGKVGVPSPKFWVQIWGSTQILGASMREGPSPWVLWFARAGLWPQISALLCGMVCHNPQKCAVGFFWPLRRKVTCLPLIHPHHPLCAKSFLAPNIEAETKEGTSCKRKMRLNLHKSRFFIRSWRLSVAV